MIYELRFLNFGLLLSKGRSLTDGTLRTDLEQKVVSVSYCSLLLPFDIYAEASIRTLADSILSHLSVRITD